LLNTIAFPRGTHPDEIAKVKLILSGDNSFAHPILMLELARAANALAGLTDPQSIVELGRACAVLAGGLAVFASFLLAREVLPASAALAATIAVAVVPLVTVHARFFKEDIFALPFLLLALTARHAQGAVHGARRVARRGHRPCSSGKIYRRHRSAVRHRRPAPQRMGNR
jgi:Dolichyl-phosphate-mannose-protein mannosyltransferase